VTTNDNTVYRKAFLLALVIGVSIALIMVLEAFLMTLMVAAILAGLFRPVFMRAVRLAGGRQHLAAAFTVVFTLFVVIVPLLAVTGLVVSAELRNGEVEAHYAQQLRASAKELNEVIGLLRCQTVAADGAKSYARAP
jgi:predicted PurR-regulated permease PerM